MNKLHLSLIWTVALFALLSCSSSNNKFYPVRNKTPRISTLGFNISPPPGKNWYESQIDNSLVYFKNTTPNTYAITTHATELFFKDSFTNKKFLEYVKKSKNLHEDSETRYQNCNLKYTLENTESRLCVRYDHNYDDYEDKGRGDYAFVKVVSRGRVCLHPQYPRVGIDVNYVEKFIPQANDTSFRNEGEIFISSLRFSPAAQ